VLPQMNPIDLGQIAAGLQGSTFEPLGLPKLETLLLDVLDRLAAVELQSGAYSGAAVELLMRMPQQQQQQSAGDGRSSSSNSSRFGRPGSSSSSSMSSSSSSSVERRRRSSAGPAVGTAADVSSSRSSTTSTSKSSDGQAAAAAAEDVEVAGLKQQLHLQQQQPSAVAAELFTPDLDSLEISGAFDMTVVQHVSSGGDAMGSISKTAPAAAV
jgi:hypothetical protein